jgi:hemerythrin
MLIVWKDEFVVDEGIIDDDHKFLVSTLNEIIGELNDGATRGAFLARVRELRDFAILHFRREERLQQAAAYPDFAHHRIEHDVLVEQLDTMICRTELLPHGEPVVDVRGLRSFFYRWILGHIIESDLKIRPFVVGLDTSAERSLLQTAA